jgi:hypothetical protein
MTYARRRREGGESCYPRRTAAAETKDRGGCLTSNRRWQRGGVQVVKVDLYIGACLGEQKGGRVVLGAQVCEELNGGRQSRSVCGRRGCWGFDERGPGRLIWGPHRSAERLSGCAWSERGE